MNTINFIAVSAISGLLLTICNANADDSTPTTPDVSLSPIYKSQELSIDAFGSGSINQQTLDHISGQRVRHDGEFGGGGGLNYFFCRYVGIGGEYDAEGDRSRTFEMTAGNLIVRIPIAETGLAPYAFGGGGYQFDALKQGYGQVGAGLEFRFVEHVGLFADARYVIADKTENYGLARVGLRFNF